MCTRKLFVLLTVVASLGGMAACAFAADAPAKLALPKLLDLGAGTCIPCKQMAPVLEELKRDLAGKLDVEFVDVSEKPEAADKYGIRVIPTQIFFSAEGKELFRHEGFFSRDDILAKWRDFGVLLAVPNPRAFSRWEPARPDTRSKDSICYMCDGDISPKTKVTVRTAKGDVNLCSMHHFFVMLSSLTTDVSTTETSATVVDWATGTVAPVRSAVYLYSFDEDTGRPNIKAFAAREAALAEREKSGGSLLDYVALRGKELANRCGFCDRAVYPEDAAVVKVGGVYSSGCCSHCALGVAARTGADIEVHERDRLTGEPIVVTTHGGQVAFSEPSTAVAWFGQITKPDGTHVSAGCFHQGFFASPDNLKKWVEAHPLETGEMVTIGKVLADKMALTPQQISGACKIGECAPK